MSSSVNNNTKNKKNITLVTVGDIIISGNRSETIFEGVSDVLRAGDITFANGETVYSDQGYPSPVHAGHPAPEAVPALVDAGIDIVSLANNHTLDWGPEALLDSIERVKKAGIQVVGVGENLEEARKPVIIEKKGNRIGFLAYGCVGPDGYEAWDNKPGYAPVRSWTIYEKWDYQPGTPPRINTFAYKDDLAAMVDDIKNLRSKVDVVVVYFHWGLHMQQEVIPMYGFEIGHAAVDAGADIILGSHAHILKGIEVYKGKVIFHGQSDFAANLNESPLRSNKPTIEWVTFKGGKIMRGWDIYRGGKIMREMYKFEADPESPGVWCPQAKYTMIAKISIEQGKISKVTYLPCYRKKDGQPEILKRNDPRSKEVVDYIENITRSQKLSANFVLEGDEVVITT